MPTESKHISCAMSSPLQAWPLSCPLCHEPLDAAQGALQCGQKHSYDIARQGYVNLLAGQKSTTVYENKNLFLARRAVYNTGFFQPIVNAIDGMLPEGGRVLDAGCGEGSLLHALQTTANPGKARHWLGLDIIKDAVRMAAGAYKQIAWCVGDICNIPLADGATDALINMLTPANYAEFSRVLHPDGLLIKIIPNADHLREIREATRKPPYAHLLDKTLTVFEKHFSLSHRQIIRYTVPCGDELSAQVFQMTPLTSRVSPDIHPPSASMTVDVTLLVGQRVN